MNINSYILKDELSCIEGNSLHSKLYEIPLTNCLIWQEGMPLLSNNLYIIYKNELATLKPCSQPLTFLCIGDARGFSDTDLQNDILWVKEYLSPEILFTMVVKIIRKYKNYTDNLWSLCKKAGSFQEITDYILSVFGNPLLLLGAHWELLQIYENSESCRLPFSVRSADSDFLVTSLLQCIQPHKTTPLQPWSSANTPQGIPLDYYTKYSGSDISLRLCLIGTVCPITDSHRLLLAHTAQHLEYLLHSLHFNYFQGMDSLLQNLHQYLKNPDHCGNNRVYIRESLNNIGWSPEDTYTCIILKSASNLPLHDYDLPKLSILTHYSLMLPFEDRYIFLCNMTRLRHTPQWIHEELHIALKETILSAGISTSFQDFYSFPDYCSQAYAAIRTGSELNYTHKVYLYQNYALDYIIKEGLSSFPLHVLLYGSLKELLLQDKIHQTQYCQTLKVFFQNAMTMTPTAKELGIHLSTLKYRLKRIHEILGLNLNDPNTKMYLQIILYMLENYVQIN